MRIEQSDPRLFIGLHTAWTKDGLQISPDLRDPWGAVVYDRNDCQLLRHFTSWGPRSVKKATIKGVLARCCYLSSTVDARINALWLAFVALIRRAKYPQELVLPLALKWVKGWRPRCTIHGSNFGFEMTEAGLHVIELVVVVCLFICVC